MSQTPGSSIQLRSEPGPSGWRQDGPRFALVAWLIATIVMLVALAVVAIIVVIVVTVRASLAEGHSDDRLVEISQEALTSEAFSWTSVIVSQVVLLVCAWLACRILRKSARERLGLLATSVRPIQGTVLLVACVVPMALGLLAASLVGSAVGSSDDDAPALQQMWLEGSRVGSVAWVLLIAILPGFVEEVFYRGFLQRGLLLRWGPVSSIFTSSVLFGAVHGDLVWAVGIFPLGVWLGVVAWRTGSVVISFMLHASVNGLWTAGMMILNRAPESEAVLNWIVLVVLVLGVIAFPWAIVILRRQGERTSVTDTPGARLLPRVVGVAVVAGALLFLVIPPGVLPAASEETNEPRVPTLAELESSVVDGVDLPAVGERGAVAFALEPGGGTRVALPGNRIGIDSVVLTLDATGDIVWLTYAGESSGKGGKQRPAGIVEQLASGDPTVLCMTISEGPPPVNVRLWIEEDEAMSAAVFERAKANGWAQRGRK